MLALTFTKKLRPITMGSDSGWFTLAGRGGPAPGHLVSNQLAAHALTQGHELHLGRDLAPPGVVHLGDGAPGLGPQRRTARTAEGLHLRSLAQRAAAVVAQACGTAGVLLHVAARRDPGAAKGGQSDVGIRAGPAGIVQPLRRVGLPVG
jgi:hypothetical protein